MKLPFEGSFEGPLLPGDGSVPTKPPRLRDPKPSIEKLRDTDFLRQVF